MHNNDKGKQKDQNETTKSHKTTTERTKTTRKRYKTFTKRPEMTLKDAELLQRRAKRLHRHTRQLQGNLNNSGCFKTATKKPRFHQRGAGSVSVHTPYFELFWAFPPKINCRLKKVVTWSAAKHPPRGRMRDYNGSLQTCWKRREQQGSKDLELNWCKWGGKRKRLQSDKSTKELLKRIQTTDLSCIF